MSTRRLAFDPQARIAFAKGFDTLASALEVTLGPRGRLVAVARDNPRRAPELLDDGAMIARRFTGVRNRFESMGAYLARHIAWQVEESVGDGSTTAVILARHILNVANRYVAAGFNSMRLRRGIERALPMLLAQLQQMAVPLEAPSQIRALVSSIAASEQIGELLAEIFDVVGPYGAIEVRNSYARTHDRRYINGTLWNQGWVSSHFATDGGTAVVKEPFILLTSRNLASAHELAPIMEAVRAAGDHGLDHGFVVIANGIEGSALNVLVSNKTRNILPTLAIRSPGLGSEKSEILTDLAVLTGGRVFLAESAESLANVTLGDLGRAREIRAIRSGFTLIGGKGRPTAIRTRSQQLREQIPTAAYGRDRDRLIERAGKLIGGVAILEIGGHTDSEREYNKDRAKEAIHVVRHALQSGVVPGGGVAFLRCLPALDTLSLPPDEAAGVDVIRAALLAPLRAILSNSGLEPEPIIAQLHARRNGCIYDVTREQFIDGDQVQLVDPLKVVQTALQAGISGALMALTTDVLVHRPRHNRDEEVDFRP